MADSTQTQTNSDFLTPNPNDNVDIGSILTKLLQSVNTGNLNGSGGINGTSPQPNAYQKGVNKALTDAGTAHATQALASGVDPNTIVNHPMMNTFGGGGNPSGGATGTWGNTSTQSTPDPKQVLSSIAQPQQSQTQQPKSIDDQISDINKQAQLNLAKQNLAQSKPPDFLQRFSQQFSKMTGGQTQGETLQNIDAMQKIAGGEPLQPKDVATLNANTYSAALDATHQSAALEAAKLPALTDLYGKLQATRGIGATIAQGPSTEQNKVIEALSTAGQNLNTHISNLQTLINNRPTFSSKGMDKQAQQTTSKITEGQTATNQKTGQKIMYKGGQWIPM